MTAATAGIKETAMTIEQCGAGAVVLSRPWRSAGSPARGGWLPAAFAGLNMLQAGFHRLRARRRMIFRLLGLRPGCAFN